MKKRKKLKNVVDLGLRLDKLDQSTLEKLSQCLGELLTSHLNAVLGPEIDFQASIELEVSETLDLSVDLLLVSPNPLTPEVLAEVDRELEKAIGEFEETILSELKGKQNDGPKVDGT